MQFEVQNQVIALHDLSVNTSNSVTAAKVRNSKNTCQCTFCRIKTETSVHGLIALSEPLFWDNLETHISQRPE